jgi:hypothetical protein
MPTKKYTWGNMLWANAMIALSTCVICASFMPKMGEKTVRLEACRYGFAHYAADRGTGEPRFIWNKELLPAE